VLLTDAVETSGRTVNQTLVARQLGVPIDVVPLEVVQRGPDLVAEGLVAPTEVQALEPFELRLQTRAPSRTHGRLILYRNDSLMGELPIQIGAGLDVVTIPQMIDGPGLYRFRVVLEADDDVEARNNEVRTSVRVAGNPRILLLEGDGDAAAAPLAAVLRADGNLVTVGGAADLPHNLEAMAPYDALILSDIPATGMTRTQLFGLERFVTELGRGLVMLGGDRSFGLGGYFMTPVEDVMPVNMRRRAPKERPIQGIVLAIDKSASMSDARGASKIDFAKDASAAVVELLGTQDELGVVAFDGAVDWVYRYQLLAEKADALGRIATLRAGGGTDIYNALRSAYRAIAAGSAPSKHVILLSDGITERSDLAALAKEMRSHDITLTTVAIGSETDRYTMETLAELGGGRYYETESAEVIPQIFTRETMLVSQALVVEGPLVPAAADPSNILAGLAALPELGGYIATSAKPAATVALVSPAGDPILAHWRQGLGKALAFTSDAKQRWASSWLERPEVYSRFWNQTLRWLVQTSEDGGLAVVAQIRGGTLALVGDSLDEDNATIEGAETRARVVFPDGRVHPVELTRVAPGRYTADIEAPDIGTYYVSIVQTLNGKEVGRSIREVYRAFSPEFAPTHDGGRLQQEVASTTRGRLRPSADEVWLHPDSPLTAPRPLIPYLLAAAAVLWVLDVAGRKLDGFRTSRRPDRGA
jgi:uncharacterized membrane protein